MHKFVMKIVVLLFLLCIMGESRLAENYYTSVKNPKFKSERNKQSTAQKCHWVCHFPGSNAVAIGSSGGNGPAIANGGSVDIAVGNGQLDISGSTQHHNGNSVKPTVGSNGFGNALAIGGPGAIGPAVANGGSVDITVGNGSPGIGSSNQHSNGKPGKILESSSGSANAPTGGSAGTNGLIYDSTQTNGKPGVGSSGSSTGKIVISGTQLGGNAAAVGGRKQSAIANGGNTKLTVTRTKTSSTLF